jgi:hypothetical protein
MRIKERKRDERKERDGESVMKIASLLFSPSLEVMADGIS